MSKIIVYPFCISLLALVIWRCIDLVLLPSAVNLSEDSIQSSQAELMPSLQILTDKRTYSEGERIKLIIIADNPLQSSIYTEDVDLGFSLIFDVLSFDLSGTKLQ